MSDRKVTISLFGDDRDLATKIRDSKAKLDALVARAKNVKIGADDKDLQVKLADAKIKLDKLDAKEVKPELGLAGVARFDAEVDKASLKLDKLEAKAALAGMASGGGQGFTQLGSNLGSLSNFAIPALVTGLVAVSGQIATVTFGLGAFGLAAFKDIEPIIKVSRLSGGLAGNLDKLDKTQRTAALSLLGLGSDFNKFTNDLKPEVLGSFNKALSVGATLLHGTEPIAKAAGKAFEGVLGSIDAEFKSGTWIQFFGFMKKEAGPDVRQLGMLFTDLLSAIPPVTEALHPLGAVIINDLDSITKFIGGLGQLSLKLENFNIGVNKAVNTHVGNGFNLFGTIKSGTAQFLKVLNPAIPLAGQLAGKIEQMGASSKKTAGQQSSLATAAEKAAAAAAKEQQDMNSLATSIGNVANKILQLQGDEVSWKQAQQAATKAINATKGSLDGNSQSALAAKQAMIQSSQAAITLAQREITLHGNTGRANQILNAQIQYLATHAGKSKFAQQEILALIQAENRIPGNIHSTIHASTAAAARAIANIENRMAALNGQTSTVYIDYSIGGQSYVVGHHRHTGNAKGTTGAAPGWSWVGERGPELIHLKGGEHILNNYQSMKAARSGFSPGSGFADGTMSFPDAAHSPSRPSTTAVVYNINVHPTPLASPADTGRQVVEAIREFEKRSGTSWRS